MVLNQKITTKRNRGDIGYILIDVGNDMYVVAKCVISDIKLEIGTKGKNEFTTVVESYAVRLILPTPFIDVKRVVWETDFHKTADDALKAWP